MRNNLKINLNGLLYYKLQFTSFFSIMQRITAVLILSVMCYYFAVNYVINSLNFFLNINVYAGLNFFIFLLVLFFFSFHFINGLRIFAISTLYFQSFSSKSITSDNSVISFVFNFYLTKFKESRVLSNLSNKTLSKIQTMISYYFILEEVLKYFFFKSRLIFILFIFIFYLISVIVYLFI
jgi:succinate dehydrogenase/fumarate reductase cytochrome b subunit